MQPNRARQRRLWWFDLGWIGRLGGPLLAWGVYRLLPAGDHDLSEAGRATAAVGCLMAIWWLTEALPLAATALLPIVLFPLAGVMPIRQAAAPFAREYIFLFMGGFMLALAMERWNLHRRIALLTVLAAGTSPARLVGGFMLAAALLSMWISNTATTVMLLPIGLSLVALLSDRLDAAAVEDLPPGSRPSPSGSEGGPSPSNSEDGPSSKTFHGDPHFATCLMLGTAYAASIGGMGTLIGTPPNLFMAGFVEDTYGIQISFARWTAMALPLVAVFLLLAWIVLTRWVYPLQFTPIAGGRRLIRGELAKLGTPSRGEWTVLVVFLLTAAAWITREPLAHWTWLVELVPPVGRLHDAQIALTAALTLFLIPVDARRGVFALDWQTAKRLPWGILLLFGGGLSLAAAFQASGLTEWIGRQIAALGHLPPLGLITLVTLTILLLTELTSNLATVSAFLPILGGVAVGIGMDPMTLIVPAGLAASCAFMMPVATPPNAIVFGSGHVTIRQMVKAGVWLNLIGLVLIILAVRLAANLGWTPGSAG